MHYVVGFVFKDIANSHWPANVTADQEPVWLVALIQKNRPDYLAGMLNGPGGGVERGETAAQAVAREFNEETSLTTAPSEWTKFAVLNTVRGDRIDLFYARYCGTFGSLVTMTDESVGWYSLDELGGVNLTPHACFMIPMAMAHMKGDLKKVMNIIETPA